MSHSSIGEIFHIGPQGGGGSPGGIGPGTVPARRAHKRRNQKGDAGRDQEKIDAIGDAIMDLREERQNILTEAAMRKDVKDRIDDLASFLDEQNEEVTEYSETLVRRLIERITVYDEMLVVEFKSGLQIEVET